MWFKPWIWTFKLYYYSIDLGDIMCKLMATKELGSRTICLLTIKVIKGRISREEQQTARGITSMVEKVWILKLFVRSSWKNVTSLNSWYFIDLSLIFRWYIDRAELGLHLHVLLDVEMMISYIWFWILDLSSLSAVWFSESSGK